MAAILVILMTCLAMATSGNFTYKFLRVQPTPGVQKNLSDFMMPYQDSNFIFNGRLKIEINTKIYE